jgi:hypothetical protein
MGDEIATRAMTAAAGPPYPVENRANLPAEEFAALAAAVAAHRSVKHALDWLLGMTPPVPPADLVTQDEFSHDVLFAYPTGCWLVYDCT